MTVLGIDASTSTTGFAYSNNKNIIRAGFIDTSKIESRTEMAHHITNIISDMSIPFDEIHIEESLSGFSGGGTRQQTIIKLAKFNAVLCFILESTFNVPVIEVNPNTARKQLFGKSFERNKKTKEFVKERLERIVNLSAWEVLNTRGNLHAKNYDMYDAVVMSLYEYA